ncbi:MAG: IS21 family transposase [Pirellulaceae bacterium]
MANRLSMATIDAVFTLHDAGHSNRRIAELLGVHRETVGRYLAQSEAENRPNAPTGSDAPGRPENEGASGLNGIVVAGESTAQSGPPSVCEPYRELILAKLEAGLSAKRIHQDLVDEYSVESSYWSVRRFVAKLRQKTPLPFRRMETGPGEEAQIDFGTGASVVGPDGKRRRPWVLRVVLSYSRKGYSEVVYRQSTEAFIQCIENAFHHFGGVVKTLVIDNLKAAVAKADWYDPEIHPKLQSFAAHYGTTFLPTKPYMPRHKGKVENGINYVKENGLKGRTFSSLTAENAHLLDWETGVADTRIHGTTKRQVGRLFDEVEQAALIPLPAERFPFFHEGRRSVHRDGYVEIDKAYYSAPPEYVGWRLWARWDGRLIRLFNHRWEQVAIHAKTEPGQFRTAAGHIPAEKVSPVERGADALLRQVAIIGPQTRQWAEAMTQARGVRGIRVLIGLKNLASKHRAEEMEKACETALSHGAYRLRTVRILLKRQVDQRQEQFSFLEEHPIIRPLSDYSLDSLRAFRKEHDER